MLSAIFVVYFGTIYLFGYFLEQKFFCEFSTGQEKRSTGKNSLLVPTLFQNREYKYRTKRSMKNSCRFQVLASFFREFCASLLG
jgi:hypothetical protein